MSAMVPGDKDPREEARRIKIIEPRAEFCRKRKGSPGNSGGQDPPTIS